MSKSIARASVRNTFRNQLFSSYLLKIEHERATKYLELQRIASNNRDDEEVARLEGLISKIVLV